MATPTTLKRLQALLWVLIYGGLLTLVLGLATRRLEDALGWALIIGGGLAAGAGFTLIVVRSLLKED